MVLILKSPCWRCIILTMISVLRFANPIKEAHMARPPLALGRNLKESSTADSLQFADLLMMMQFMIAEAVILFRDQSFEPV
jgi:hypothetical protein